MSLQSALRGVADQITALARPATNLGFANGQIVSVTSGILTVAVCGDQVQAPYYGSLPAVGDTVGVLFIDGAPTVLGVLHGIPTF